MPKYILYLYSICFAMVTILVGCASPNNSNDPSSASKSGNHVEVIYFRGKMRCLTCKVMEKVAKETVDSIFANEAQINKVIFNTYDIQQDDSLANDYQVIGSSLFVTTFIDGKEERVDLTEFGLLTARKDRKAFKDSLERIIRESLKNI